LYTLGVPKRNLKIVIGVSGHVDKVSTAIDRQTLGGALG
jgi:hypothetical protein